MHNEYLDKGKNHGANRYFRTKRRLVECGEQYVQRSVILFLIIIFTILDVLLIVNIF